MDQCGNYFIEDLECLGRGGFGEVYKVNVHNLTKTNVTTYARKYFSPSPENNNTTMKEIADLRQRFLVEIRTQCALNAINNGAIAPIVMFSPDGVKPYFVMELAESNLRDAIDEGMSEADKEGAVRQIINGLKTIHENEYLHRDIKPGNILRYPGGIFKITDFGLVKDLNDIRAEVHTKFDPNGMGTDGYRAQEVSDFGEFSCRSDIYALGKVIGDIYGGHNQSVKKVISKCTSHFSEDRYSSADEVLEAFEDAMLVTEPA